MERQIKFRGKTVINGEWVYGSLETFTDDKQNYARNKGYHTSSKSTKNAAEYPSFLYICAYEKNIDSHLCNCPRTWSFFLQQRFFEAGQSNNRIS